MRGRQRRVIALAHSAYARERAAQLFAGRTDVRVAGPFPGTSGAARAVRAVARERPRVVYVVDVGLSTSAAAPVARLLGARLIVDTGDLAFALARSTGSRSAPGLAAVWAGERLSLALASHVIVRGTAHVELLGEDRATYAPDLPPPRLERHADRSLREELGLGDRFVVGLVGSLAHAPRLGTCYGWDLIEALPRTRQTVAALIVGDGDGAPTLRARAAELGVADRCRFVGAVPTSEIADWVGAMDAGISTQTNDAVGAVRTTGKLPLYLACGCPVLASDVGEARRLLGPLGWTIPYRGVVDRGYPVRLAAAIDRWAEDPAGAAARREEARALAREAFDPREVAARVSAVVDAELQR